MSNHLSTSLAEFKSAITIFSKGKITDKSALIAFDGNYLSIEIGSKAAVMVSEGEWSGRATVSSQIIRALALNPPVVDPVRFVYKNGKLQFAGINLSCKWELVSKKGIRRTLNPSTLELLAIEKTVDRHELGRTSLGKKCNSALLKLEKSIEGAMKHLSEFGVQEEQIRLLISKNINAIIEQSN